MQDVAASVRCRATGVQPSPSGPQGAHMTELASPSAKRLQRPSWRDSRLVVGILLVVVAATLGAKAVASADDRVPVWVAGSDLVAGDRVDASSFVRADVQLGDGTSRYLGADAPAPPLRRRSRGARSSRPRLPRPHPRLPRCSPPCLTQPYLRALRLLPVF